MNIGILGGTGKEGSGLAYRWALAGHNVTIGSRDAAKAAAGAAELNQLLCGKATVRGSGNDTAADADVIVLTVPFAAQMATAESVAAKLAGKIFVDVTVPLAPPKVDRVQLPNGESAVVALQRKLGPQVKVVSAFQNVSATHLKEPGHAVDCDVLVCGDDADARVTFRIAGANDRSSNRFIVPRCSIVNIRRIRRQPRHQHAPARSRNLAQLFNCRPRCFRVHMIGRHR